MATKKVTITMTDEHQHKALDGSVGLFGKPNLSGFIQVLIQRDYEERKRRQK